MVTVRGAGFNISEGVKTRAMREVGQKGGETKNRKGKKLVLTKPATSASLEEGEVVTSDVDVSLPAPKKRRKISNPGGNVWDHVFLTPKAPLKRKKSAKSSSTPSPQSSPSIVKKKVGSMIIPPKVVRQQNTEFKIDRLFQWFQDMQEQQNFSRSRSRSRVEVGVEGEVEALIDHQNLDRLSPVVPPRAE